MSGERPEIESNDYINHIFRMIHKTSHEYQVYNFYTSQTRYNRQDQGHALATQKIIEFLENQSYSK